MNRFTALFTLVLLVPGGARATAGSFKPDVARLVPALAEQYDLDLLKAGKPAARFKRALDLESTLPGWEEINFLQHMDKLVGWLAVLALVESAVLSAEQVPDVWDLKLVKIYRRLSAAENALDVVRSAVAVMALQPGAKDHPSVKLSKQLIALAQYGRSGLRWVAARRLKKSPGDELRRELLEGLCEVDRREGKWKQMQMVAATLCDLKATKSCAAFEAEALFELGKMQEAERALKRAARTASKSDLERAKLRKRLAKARAASAGGKNGAEMAKVAAILLELSEPWRVLEMLSEQEVIKAANPRLDEAYIRAFMEQGLLYQKAWAFGRKARGAPPTPHFLSRRIGAGLMRTMSRFYAGRGRGGVDRRTMEALDSDLALFRPADEKLADLTSTYLAFITFIGGDMQDAKARKEFLEKAQTFNSRYPTDLSGVQMIYLCAQLGVPGAKAWQTLNRYRRGLRGKPIPDEFLAVYVGAAVRRALVEKDSSPVDAAANWIESRAKKDSPATFDLWNAHLIAVRGLLAEKTVMASALQNAVNAYGKVVEEFGNSVKVGSLDAFCDAIASVGTLMMQGGGLDDVRRLLDQAAQVCGAYPATAALRAVCDMAAGKSAKPAETIAALDQAAGRLDSRQARIQALLWLAVASEASGAKKESREYYEKAAGLIKEERSRGAIAPLAPDLRSMVASSGSFSMSMGYSPASPFGLVIEVVVLSRMFLFPPAAVDEAKMASYL
jgi:tetratricopeptide (TPR) repeat protein